MYHGRIRAEGRSRGSWPTRVAVELSKFTKSCGLTRRKGFVVSLCSGPISEIVAECQSIAPCVLVVSQESLEKLGADEFSASVGVGDSVRVLVLGTRKSPDLAERFLSMGCMGYLPHDVRGPTVRRAVRAIASGQVWADRSTITQVIKGLFLRYRLKRLTRREKEILRLIVSGLSNRAIADRLCITHETVRWHIRGVYSKLGVQDRFSAIVFGKRLLDSESGAVPSGIPNVLTPQSPGDAPEGRH